jgi:AcrR family transcriptional regulator
MKTGASASTEKRRYRMVTRADAAAATRRSIADSWLALFSELQYDEITLEAVAERAGVTVPTVIRHFGSKDELFAAVARELVDEEAKRRAETPVGDIPRAVRALVGRYELVGDAVLRLLAQEDRFAALREVADGGRRIHYEWVDRVFGPLLESRSGVERRYLRAKLVAVTDIYVWKVLRRDLGLGRGQVQTAIAEMVGALVDGGK